MEFLYKLSRGYPILTNNIHATLFLILVSLYLRCYLECLLALLCCSQLLLCLKISPVLLQHCAQISGLSDCTDLVMSKENEKGEYIW